MTEPIFETPFGPEGIEELIPHRAPFRWVTQVLELEPGVRCLAELQVDPDLEIFKGHFPHYPVLPGVITMEALAQTACIAMSAGFISKGEAGGLGLFAGIDKARFTGQVSPGDTLTLEATITKSSRRIVKAEVLASVAGKKVASAEQTYAIVAVD